MSMSIDRPIDPALHPLATGDYRIATPAIRALYHLVLRCLRYRITGGLSYAPPRMGKTRAIDYVRLLLAREHPRVTTYHARIASTSRDTPRDPSSRTSSRRSVMPPPTAAPPPRSASASPPRSAKRPRARARAPWCSSATRRNATI